MKPFRLWIYRLMTFWLPETRGFHFKVCLLRWAGAKIGSNVRIGSTAYFFGDGELVVGDDVWIGANSYICPAGSAKIEIGSHVDVGPQVMIITGSHKIDRLGAHIGGEGYTDTVRIGDGCWVGAGAKLLPGVSLSGKTVVAAGAVVAKGVYPTCVLLAGVPASVRKEY